MTATKRLFSGTKLACMRGGRILFQNLSFDLDPGDVAHVAGPNGAGKTSLLRLLSGILPPLKGKVTWEGRDFLKEGRDTHAARLAFLPAGEQGLKPQDTAEETLRFWLACLPQQESTPAPESTPAKAGAQRASSRNRSLENENAAAAETRAGPPLSRGWDNGAITTALEKMNLEKLRDTPVRLLSSGQRRRLSFARVLLAPAKLWLLDEPLNGLDYESCGLFDDALDAHCKDGGIALLASHYAVTPPKHGKIQRITLGGTP